MEVKPCSDTLIEAAIDLPVSVEEMRKHLRIDFEDDNALLETYIKAAADHLGTIANRAICQETRVAVYPLPERHLWLGRPHLQAVSRIWWRDADGDEIDLGIKDYEVHDRDDPWLAGMIVANLPAGLDQPIGLRVEYTCGWGYPELVPEALRQAVRLLAGSYYANREDAVPGVSMTTLPTGVGALIAPHRWRGLV